MTRIRIGTRASKLALWQANYVADQLRSEGHDVEIMHIATQGDVSRASLSEVGGQGVFTKEIQHALIEDRVDLAVHSLKDLPTQPIEGLTIAAVPPRELTLDCLISGDRLRFEQLPPGASIGTGSSRRGAQLLAWRPDVVIKDIRGNVDTRLAKMRDGHYDAIVLAAAGLQRLGLYEQVSQELPQDKILPAIGQGALGLECREDKDEVLEAVQTLNDTAAHQCVRAERKLLAALLAGCMAPVAALATVRSADCLHLKARVLSPSGDRMIEAESIGKPREADSIGEVVADNLRSRGAEELITLARS